MPKRIIYLCQWTTYGDDSAGHRHGAAEGSAIKILDDLSIDFSKSDIPAQNIAGIFITRQPIDDKTAFDTETKIGDIPGLEAKYRGEFVPTRTFRSSMADEKRDDRYLLRAMDVV